MSQHEPNSDINVSKIPVEGIGGLGLVAMAVVVTMASPALRWIAVAALVGGVALGLTLIGIRNRRERRHVMIGGAILALVVAAACFAYAKWPTV